MSPYLRYDARSPKDYLGTSDHLKRGGAFFVRLQGMHSQLSLYLLTKWFALMLAGEVQS